MKDRAEPVRSSCMDYECGIGTREKNIYCIYDLSCRENNITGDKKMAKKCVAVVKNILDQNGCNYQIEKKRGQITFTLDNQYNDLFEDCPIYFFVIVERHKLVSCAILKSIIKGESQVPVSRLLSRINRDIAVSGIGTDLRFDLDIQGGVVDIRYMVLYRKCPEDYEIATVMSIPLFFMHEFGKWIIAVACGEVSVEEAYEEIQNIQEESVNKAFFDIM